ncbi:MAG TPA: DUF192 domain-containing protein [Chlamydiales bacterium]|nr:DUF192 domain-containing protein [Chlamydiales bacterium]
MAKIEIELGGEILTVEVAATLKEQYKGLTGRKKLSETEGMLFVYSKPQRLSFWMKDTTLPLSIGFFDAAKTLVQIENMDPPTAERLPSYQSKARVQYALEVAQGWFQRHEVVEGMKFSFHDPSLDVK